MGGRRRLHHYRRHLSARRALPTLPWKGTIFADAFPTFLTTSVGRKTSSFVQAVYLYC